MQLVRNLTLPIFILTLYVTLNLSTLLCLAFHGTYSLCQMKVAVLTLTPLAASP